MTTPIAISKCFKFSKNIPLRSLIQLHLNPIATVNSTQTVSESQLKLHRFESRNPNSSFRNDVADVVKNQMSLCGGEMAAVVARGRAVKIDDEFEEDVEDDSDEFESEDEDEFDEMDGEDCLDDDDEDEDPVYKKRK